MRFASALPRIALGLYGTIGLVINAQALASGRGPIDIALIALALALDVAAIFATVRFGWLIDRARVWLERLVQAIMAYMVLNAGIAAWRGGAPFYYLVATVYVLVGIIVWRTMLARIRAVAATPSDERSDTPPTDG